MTFEEIFAEVEDLNDLFSGYIWGDDKEKWEVVSNEITDYDEGNVIRDIVLRYIPENRYFEATTQDNSWDDYGDESIKLDDIREVKPVEKTITVYEGI